MGKLIAITEVNFPDAELRQRLITRFAGEVADTDAKFLCLNNVLKLARHNISSFKGIELFKNLEVLDISNNDLTTECLDLRPLKKLRQLICHHCGIVDMKLPTSVEYLDCSYNVLKTLDLTRVKVKKLFCSHNLLENINGIGKSVETIYAECNNLKKIDLSRCRSMYELLIAGNKIDKLNLSNCPNLKILDVIDNMIEYLDLSNNTLIDQLYASSQKGLINTLVKLPPMTNKEIVIG